MVCYIDAVFRLRNNVDGSPAAEKAAGGSSCTGISTSDDEMMNDHPCYMWEPVAIAAATGDGHAELFRLGGPADILKSFNYFLSTLNGNEIYVGWNMDQIVIPILCSCAFTNNVCLPSRLFRRLDDKWSKPAGASVERAFMQGWYSSSKSEVPRLTLQKATEIAGINPLDRLIASMDGGNELENLLMSRISCISSIYTFYQELLARCER